VYWWLSLEWTQTINLSLSIRFGWGWERQNLVLFLEACETECAPFISKHMHDLRSVSQSTNSCERACRWMPSSQASVVHEAHYCQHMEEVEEKEGSAEVEVTMWVSNEGKSLKRRLRSYRRSSMLGQRIGLRIRCLKGTSGLLHSMPEVFGKVWWLSILQNRSTRCSRVSMQSSCQVLWSTHSGSAMNTLSIGGT
jgi:hypothetical protein